MTGLPDVLPSAFVDVVSEVVISGEVIVFVDVVISAEVVIAAEVDTSGMLVDGSVLVGNSRLDVPAKEIISAMARDMEMNMKNRAGQLMGEESMELSPVVLGVPLQSNQVWDGSPGTLKRVERDRGQGYLLCSPLLWCPLLLWCFYQTA